MKESPSASLDDMEVKAKERTVSESDLKQRYITAPNAGKNVV